MTGSENPSPAMRERTATPNSVRGRVGEPAAEPHSPSRTRHAGEEHGREPILVYRHRMAPQSEVAFLNRFYVGFERLTPIWLGCHIEPGAALLAGDRLRLGHAGPFGSIERTLFRHCGLVPAAPNLGGLQPRLIHAHFGRGGAIALPIARALGIPLVVTFHGGDATKETHYRQRLVPRVYARRLAALKREAALFVCVSEFVRDRLLARGFPAEKLAVIRQGVEIDAPMAPEPPRPAEPYILFAGRFVAKKGVAQLIEAMRLLEARRTGLRLVLIGDGPLAAALREQAEGLDRVSFLGWLPNPEVRRWMRGALAVCVPSETASDGDAEGLPSVVFEAMAEGVPVVAARHAGIAEAVEDGHTGLLVAEGNPRALADGLAALAARPDMRRELGRAAREAAAERFNAIDQSRQLEAALLRVIGERAM